MGSFSERLIELLDKLKISKTGFAEKINVSQAFISQLCAGVKQPSDRTIYDICREFNVREEWIRSGSGEMFREMTRDEEIARAVGRMEGEDDSFKKRLIAALLKLDEKDWEVLEKVAREALKKD